ncbi:TIGR04104 family putative zinc finger protein [Salinicoccus luteus]|uniref:TIGR04104 family putative zinc finger protein n=1 Tax=Salinicoccus luteus TaxID=367840 RepID=UPI001FE069C4|nr:TIGR04104 family putative zinc finger protein [Salinicoccus luteus]
MDLQFMSGVVEMGECPYCSHEWTYREKLLGYALKPRTRIRCPRCREYLEPSTLTILYDYIAIIGLAMMVFLLIPIMGWPVPISVALSILLLVIYMAVFLPLTIRFKRYRYNMKE